VRPKSTSVDRELGTAAECPRHPAHPKKIIRRSGRDQRQREKAAKERKAAMCSNMHREIREVSTGVINGEAADADRKEKLLSALPDTSSSFAFYLASLRENLATSTRCPLCAM
jgi:hypothetical protein